MSETDFEITPEMLYALQDAASYFLMASENNFDSGEPDLELEERQADLQLFLDLTLGV